MMQGTTTNSTTKTSHNKDEGAPIIYFIDIFESESFLNPITPIPSRVDKIFLAQSCGFVLPTQNPVVHVNNTAYSVNFPVIYENLFENLLFYAKQVANQMGRNLIQKQIEIWWKNSSRFIPMIRTYQEDIDFVIRSYLDAFKMWKEGVSLEKSLLRYTKELLAYFNSKIEYNSIEVQFKNQIKYQKMFKIKNNFKYPNVVKYDNYDVLKKKYNRKIFIPIFVYDDIIECLLYNKQILDLKLNPNLTVDNVGVDTEEELKKKYDQAKSLTLYSFERLLDENYIIKTTDQKAQEFDHSFFDKFTGSKDVDTIFESLEDKDISRLLEEE